MQNADRTVGNYELYVAAKVNPVIAPNVVRILHS